MQYFYYLILHGLEGSFIEKGRTNGPYDFLNTAFAVFCSIGLYHHRGRNHEQIELISFDHSSRDDLNFIFLEYCICSIFTIRFCID